MRRLPLIARKDFQDSARERSLYALGAMFLLLGSGIAYFVGTSRSPQSGDLVRFTLTAVLFVGALSTTALSYHTIVGKRDSGELRVLLGLPFSREEVLFGTYTGRTLAITMVSGITLLVAAVIGVALGAPVSITALLGAVVVALATVAVFAAIGVGISAACRQTTRAAGLAFGVFFVFVLRLWEVVPPLVRFLLNGFSPTRGPPPTWQHVWGQLSPMAGLHNTVTPLSETLAQSFTGLAPLEVPEGYYTEPWFGLLVVLFWLVVPLLVGYTQFREADL